MQEPLRSSFCDLDKEANVAYAHLVDSSEKTLDSLLELQEVYSTEIIISF